MVFLEISSLLPKLTIIALVIVSAAFFYMVYENRKLKKMNEGNEEE